MNQCTPFRQKLAREIFRVALLIAVGVVFIVYGVPFAQLTGQPAFAPWSLFFGGSFIAVALSHIQRRTLFSKLDLQRIAIDAIIQRNIAAAIVFLGICIVLSSFVVMAGSMLQIS